VPVLLGRDGGFFEAVIQRHHLGMNDVKHALREADCPLESMRCVYLETDGRISVTSR
jgi:uncharacterized membrane protein YcaP (DUF421 family)